MAPPPVMGNVGQHLVVTLVSVLRACKSWLGYSSFRMAAI